METYSLWLILKTFLQSFSKKKRSIYTFKLELEQQCCHWLWNWIFLFLRGEKKALQNLISLQEFEVGGWGYGWNCNRWAHKSLLEFYICENLGTWFCKDLYFRVQKIISYAVYDFFSIIQDLRQMITIIFRARNFQIQT